MDCVHHWKIETPNGAGSYRAKGLPKGETWAKTSLFGILRLVVQWLPYESGEFE